MRISDWSSDVCSSDLARDVQRDIARAYYSHGIGQQRWIQMREGRVTIVPADQRGRTDHARQFLARNTELSVARSAGRHHDRMVKVEQLGHRNRNATIQLADETEMFRKTARSQKR